MKRTRRLNVVARWLVAGIAWALLPCIGLLVMLGADVISVPGTSPVVIVVLVALSLCLPLLYQLNPAMRIATAWPLSRLIAAKLVYWMLLFALMAQLPKWHRKIFGLITVALLLTTGLAAWRLTSHFTSRPVTYRVVGDLSDLLSVTAFHQPQSQLALHLLDRFKADALSAEMYPTLASAESGLRVLFSPHSLVSSADRKGDYQRRVNRALELLPSYESLRARPEAVDRDIVLMLRARLQILDAQMSGDTSGAARVACLRDVLRNLPDPPGTDEELQPPPIDTPRLAIDNARNHMRWTVWATVYIVAAELYGKLPLKELEARGIHCSHVNELTNEADRLLEQLERTRGMSGTNALRIANNRLHLLMWRLTHHARRTGHGDGKPLVAPVDRDEVQFVTGEEQLEAAVTRIREMLSESPAPEVFVTLAEAHAMLAHAIVRRTSVLVAPTSTENELESLEEHLGYVHDYSIAAAVLGWPRDKLLRASSGTQFIHWLQSDSASSMGHGELLKAHRARMTATFGVSEPERGNDAGTE